MKSAEEILKDCFLGVIDFNQEAAIAAMKRYAEQAVDRCADEVSAYRSNIGNRQAIKKVKSELK